MSVDKPVAVLVGAQPGAGKSTIAELVRKELKQKGGYIHIGADRLREEIPLNALSYPSDTTQADAGKLVASL